MNVTGYKERHITLHDICRQTGLSTATVSRVLNQSPVVREATRAKVMKAMNDLGYVPSHAARTLARRRTDTLGVVFPEIDTGFFASVLRGVDQVAAEDGFHLMTAFSHGPEDEEKLVRRFLLEGRVDALLLMNLTLPVGAIRRAAGLGTPIVLIDRPVEGSKLPAVTMDNRRGAMAAIEHLTQVHGYRDIAMITGPADTFDAQQRLAGCRKALERAGLTLPADRIWAGQFDEESGKAAMEAWLAQGRKLPEAIFALNDAMAIGAMEALREHGLSTPGDVAMVGFDDMKAASHLGLTSVRVPMREMGQEAARMALRLVKEETGAVETCVLPTQLVVRQTCGCREARSEQRRVSGLGPPEVRGSDQKVGANVGKVKLLDGKGGANSNGG